MQEDSVALGEQRLEGLRSGTQTSRTALWLSGGFLIRIFLSDLKKSQSDKQDAS